MVIESAIDVTYAAAQILLSRVREQSNTNFRSYSMELVTELIQTAVDCRGVSKTNLILTDWTQTF